MRWGNKDDCIMQIIDLVKIEFSGYEFSVEECSSIRK